MLRLKRKKKMTTTMLTVVTIALILGGIIGNIILNNATNGKPIEVWALDEMSGKNDVEEKFRAEAEQYQTEIALLNKDIEYFRDSAVSRGNVERAERLKEDKVIKAIDMNLGGAFKGKATFIYYSCKVNGVNPLLLAAISKHETGNGTSRILNTYNNPGGITKGSGWRKYDSLEQGIEDMVQLLKREYIDKGFTSIELIQKKYCPIGAKNDPTNINKYWTPMVTKNYSKMLEEAKQ